MNVNDGMAVNMEVSAERTADALAWARQQMAELIPAEIMQELNPEIVIESGAAAAEMILSTAENKQAGSDRDGRAPRIAAFGRLPFAVGHGVHVVCEAHCPVLTRS
jgi:hypothetical protein